MPVTLGDQNNPSTVLLFSTYFKTIYKVLLLQTIEKNMLASGFFFGKHKAFIVLL